MVSKRFITQFCLGVFIMKFPFTEGMLLKRRAEYEEHEELLAGFVPTFYFSVHCARSSLPVTRYPFPVLVTSPLGFYWEAYFCRIVFGVWPSNLMYRFKGLRRYFLFSETVGIVFINWITAIIYMTTTAKTHNFGCTWLNKNILLHCNAVYYIYCNEDTNFLQLSIQCHCCHKWYN